MSDVDWIFEHVAAIFKSPAWEADVYGFIDANCVIFDNEEENKFIYTDLHAEFRDLVDNHLNQKLLDFGIDEETFYEACQSNRFKSDINKSVYDQIVAMDDFFTFKKLMVRRNMELELEAVRAIQSSQAPVVFPKDQGDEEAQYEEALKLSEDMSPTERSKLLKAEKARANGGGGAEEAKDGGDVPDEKNKYDRHSAEDQLRAAMDANLMEMDMFHKQEELEQLQLEEAIAASLAVHANELRVAQVEAKKSGRGNDDKDKPLGSHGNSMRAQQKGSMAGGSDIDDSDDSSNDEDDETNPNTNANGNGNANARYDSPSKSTSRNGTNDDDDETDIDANADDGTAVEVAEAKVIQEEVLDAKAVSSKTPVNTPVKPKPGLGGGRGDKRSSFLDDGDDDDDDKEIITAPALRKLESSGSNAEAKAGKREPTNKSMANEMKPVKAEIVLEAQILGSSSSATGSGFEDDNDGDNLGSESESGVIIIKKPKRSKKEKELRKKAKNEKEAKREAGEFKALSLNSKPILGKSALGSALPGKSISELQEEMRQRKHQADIAFRKNHELLSEQRAEALELRRGAELTENDMRLRGEHLKRQRNLIVAKKKEDREKAVLLAEHDEADKNEEFRLRMEAMTAKSKLMNGGGWEDGKDEEKDDYEEAKNSRTSEEEDADERRKNRMVNLAAGMKRDMLMKEEERMNKIQSDKFSELDKKLKHVELMRQENRQRETGIKESLKHNQSLRNSNM